MKSRGYLVNSHNEEVAKKDDLDASNFDEGNGLKIKLLEQFAEYGNLLSFEISPMFETSVYEKNKKFSELFNSDIEYTLAERQQRNRL